MSEPDDNVEALRPVYEAWGSGDWRAGAEVYGPEMTWSWSTEFPDIHGSYTDPDEARDRIREWLGGWESWRCEAEEFVVSGDTVVVLVRYLGRGKGSGAEVSQPGAHVWTMRDGRATALTIRIDRDLALRDAGIDGGDV